MVSCINENSRRKEKQKQNSHKVKRTKIEARRIDGKESNPPARGSKAAEDRAAEADTSIGPLIAGGKREHRGARGDV